MSLKVLVIPEDPTDNGYILKPLVRAILADIGKPNAKVVVLTNPRLNGYDHAVRAIRNELVDRYGFWDLWIFIPDADRATPAAMAMLERDIAAKGCRLVCSPAQPEVEIYPCVAYRADIGIPWSDVRAHPRMKEDIFRPLLQQHGDARRPGEGRDLMIEASIKNLPALFRLCPELAKLRERLDRELNPDRQ